MAQPTAAFTVMDHGRETSVVTFHMRTFTGTSPADFNGMFADIATSDRYELRTAVDGVTRGTIARETLTAIKQQRSNIPPADPEAQREEKLLVIYEDDVTKELYNVEIPAVDIASLTRTPNTDDIVLADGGPMADLVTAMETHAVSKNANAINVVRAILVGRNV